MKQVPIPPLTSGLQSGEMFNVGIRPNNPSHRHENPGDLDVVVFAWIYPPEN